MPVRPGTEGILLTGGTGFLGAHVLSRTPRAEPVYCLVRSTSPANAIQRLQASAARYCLPWNDASIIPICGTLDSAHLRLPTCRVIWHLAAAVRMTGSWDSLWPDNVRPSIRFSGHPSLIAASTLSVFVSTPEHEGVFLECDALDRNLEVYGAYAQTKTAAEYAAPEATHIRFGLLTGSRAHGCSPENDFYHAFLRGLASVGAYCDPRDPDTAMDVTPVDMAAEAWITLSAGKGIFHFANQRALRLVDLLTLLRERWGLEPISSSEFLRRIEPLPRLQRVLLRQAFFRDAPMHRFNFDLFQSTRATYDMQRTMAMGVAPPCGVPESLLSVYASL